METEDKIFEVYLKESDLHISFDRKGQLIHRSDSSQQVNIRRFYDVYCVDVGEWRYWIDSEGIELPDEYCTGKSGMFVKEKCLITYNFNGRLERVNLGDIVSMVDTQGDIGVEFIRKFYPDDCRIEEEVDHLDIGSGQHDYYDYMDPSSSFTFFLKNQRFDIKYYEEEVNAIWNWIVNYFKAKNNKAEQ